MKKVLLAVGLVSSLALAEGIIVEPRLGVNVYSKVKISADDFEGSIKGVGGVTLGAEVRTEVMDNLEVGGTLGLGLGKGGMLLPVAAVAKYKFGEGNVKPYVRGHAGYTFGGVKVLDGLKMKGGPLFGFGGGVEYNNISADLTYNVGKGKIVFEDGKDKETVKLTGSSIALTVGYAFKF